MHRAICAMLSFIIIASRKSIICTTICILITLLAFSVIFMKQNYFSSTIETFIKLNAPNFILKTAYKIFEST